MAASVLEKLVVIMHKFGIDFNEFNVKVDKREAIAVSNQNIQQVSQIEETWQPFNLTFDPNNNFVSSSLLGNGVYEYTMDRSVDTGSQGYMTASNPIYGTKGSIVFWMSTSYFFGEDITAMGGGVDTLIAGVTSGRVSDLGYVITHGNMQTVLTPYGNAVIDNSEWGLVVITKDEVMSKIYQRGILLFTGTLSSMTGSRTFFDNVDYYDSSFIYTKLGFANIAFTNRVFTQEQITALQNEGVTSNYKNILGYTPEAYYRGPHISGTPDYVPNEVY